MTYRRSIARKEFDKKTQSMMIVSRKIGRSGSRSNSSVRQLVFQATIFKISAYIEEYLKIAIENWVSMLRKNQKHTGHVPMELRSYLFWVSSRSILGDSFDGSNEKKFIESNDFKHDSFIFSLDSAELPNLEIAKTILSGKKYPSPKNLEHLFRRIGISSIFSEIDKRGRRNYRDILQSFVDVRAAIAHEDSPYLTLEDIERNISNITEVIQLIDRILFSHVVKYSGNDCWN